MSAALGRQWLRHPRLSQVVKEPGAKDDFNALLKGIKRI